MSLFLWCAKNEIRLFLSHQSAKCVIFLMWMTDEVRIKKEYRGAQHELMVTFAFAVSFQVTKMLVTLVVVFALCWLPLHLFTLILDLAPQLLDKIKTQSDERLFLGIYYFCHWLAMANSFANPIIYCFLNDSFRVSVLKRFFLWPFFRVNGPWLPSNALS